MKKLNLKELELKLPKIDENYSKILLGGDSYGEYGDRNELNHGPTGPLYDPSDFEILPPMDYDNSYDLDVSIDGYDENGGDDNDIGNVDIGNDDNDDDYDYNIGSNVNPIIDSGIPPVQLVSLPNKPTVTPQQQYLGSCVPTNASFIAGYYGSVQTPEFMMHEYGLTHNLTPALEIYWLVQGLDESQQVSFLLQQFNMTGVQNVADVIQAIDNGHPVITNVLDGSSYVNQYGTTVLGSHEVTIVGYDAATSQFEAYDSVSGSYVMINYADVNFGIMAWEIEGVKP